VLQRGEEHPTNNKKKER